VLKVFFFKFLDTFRIQCHMEKLEMSHILRAVFMFLTGADDTLPFKH